MNIAIILSGGVGKRMGIDVPKQYIEVNGKTIIQYSIETFLMSNQISAIVIGVADEWKQFVTNIVESLEPEKPVYYAKPGETRQYSIYNSLIVAK